MAHVQHYQRIRDSLFEGAVSPDDRASSVATRRCTHELRRGDGGGSDGGGAHGTYPLAPSPRRHVRTTNDFSFSGGEQGRKPRGVVLDAKCGAMAARFHRNQTPGSWCKTPHLQGAAWDADHLLPVERALLQKVRIGSANVSG
jgi:hypothetical protein